MKPSSPGKTAAKASRQISFDELKGARPRSFPTGPGHQMGKCGGGALERHRHAMTGERGDESLMISHGRRGGRIVSIIEARDSAGRTRPRLGFLQLIGQSMNSRLTKSA